MNDCQANIEFSTFWNYRREALLQLMTDASQEEKVILLNGELKLVLDALMKNPKIYCVWHHRRWCFMQGVLDGGPLSVS